MKKKKEKGGVEVDEVMEVGKVGRGESRRNYGKVLKERPLALELSRRILCYRGLS